MEMEDKQNKIIKVLMLPWLAHGHVSPFLELAKRLAIRNFHIYICSTPVILESIKKKMVGKYSSFMELVELNLPSSPELPPLLHTTNGLPPHLMIPLKNAYEMSIPQFTDILTSLKPDLVIYDFIQHWATQIAGSQGIPAIQFLTGGASTVSFVVHMFKNPGERYPFQEMSLREYEIKKMQNSQIHDVKDVERFLLSLERSCKILLVKSFREIEGKYINFLSATSGKGVVPVGPLVQDFGAENDDEDEDKEIMEWLDQKETGFVVYVSFGSEYFLTKEERDVIAKGLELSGVDFIWVVRFPQGEEISVAEALPEGFLERVGNRGKIVEGWAPQVKILKHSGTGAFISHCGWNSIMESMRWGVPIIAMPMHIDQPFNTRVLEAVGVGIEVPRDNNGDLQSEEIAKVIRKVLVEESGVEVRKKAKALSEILERKGDEEIDILAEELVGLCQKP